MAVSLSADIVMDVARAADPAGFRAAVNKLESGGDYAAVARDVALAFASADFTAGEGGRTGRAQLPFDADRARLQLGNRLGNRSGGHLGDHNGLSGAAGVGLAGGLLNADRLREGSAYEQFEAMTLQKFVEAILPARSEAWFGKGFAGDTWKSFLAQQVAAELARAGGIGIARMIERAHPGEGGARGATAALLSVDGARDRVAASRGPVPGRSV